MQKQLLWCAEAHHIACSFIVEPVSLSSNQTLSGSVVHVYCRKTGGRGVVYVRELKVCYKVSLYLEMHADYNIAL